MATQEEVRQAILDDIALQMKMPKQHPGTLKTFAETLAILTKPEEHGPQVF